MMFRTNFQSVYILSLIITGIITLNLVAINSQLMIVLTLLILLFGLPHGSLDHKVAVKYFRIDSFNHKVIFFILYTFIAFMFFALWLYLPFIAFSIFLMISAYHFGMDYKFKRYSNFKSVLIGIVVVSTPVLTQSDEILNIFGLFLNVSESLILISFMQNLAVVSLFFLIIVLIQNFKEQFYDCLEILFTVIAALILHPIVFLTLFFCFSHSVKHYFEIYSYLEFDRLGDFIKSLVPITLISFIFLAVIMTYFSENSFDETLFKSVLLLILSLTMPHMLLVELTKTNR